MRGGALLNDAQLSGMLPTSVAGGENAAGNWSLMAGFCGPGSVMLLGFLALIAPCGGSFGLPKAISLFTGVASAVVIVAAATAPPTAVAANMSRLEIMVYHSLCAIQLFGGHRRCVAGGRRLRLFSEQPGLQPVEIDVDNRRRIEGENLRQSEATADGVTERLANLRANARTDHHRHATEQRRHRGHQDRPEAQNAGLVDRFFGRQALAMFDLLGKIDQHDAVLLDDADQQYEADDRDHAQIDVNRHQQ